ncbi:hypothetical protein N7501_007808 [Penicillium viridicatum]|nr:hypothetical protein N7501_007808 [Penicillium viridicatum]
MQMIVMLPVKIHCADLQDPKELAKLNGEAFDGYMEWDPTQTITVFNKDDQAAPSQASSGPSLPFFPAITVDSNEDVLNYLIFST